MRDLCKWDRARPAPTDRASTLIKYFEFMKYWRHRQIIATVNYRPTACLAVIRDARRQLLWFSYEFFATSLFSLPVSAVYHFLIWIMELAFCLYSLRIGRKQTESSRMAEKEQCRSTFDKCKIIAFVVITSSFCHLNVAITNSSKKTAKQWKLNLQEMWAMLT